MRKKGLLAALVILAMMVLSGCGMSAEDAQSYAKSVLDANYKGEFKDYVEWTKSSEKEPKELAGGGHRRDREGVWADAASVFPKNCQPITGRCSSIW
ncbi:MAG: hypothetical protein ACLTT1_13425 [[Clostridium] scindens]